MKKICFCLMATLVVIVPGCHTYPVPPQELLSSSYGPENRDATDRMLAQMSELSLRGAQEIAVMNNQNYLSVAQAVYAAKMRYYQSLAAFLPELSVHAGTGQDLTWRNHFENQLASQPGREYQFSGMGGVTASWLLFDGLAREFAILARQSEYKREIMLDMKARCMLRRAVAYAYFDLQSAVAIEQIQQKNEEFQAKMRQIAAKNRPKNEILNFLLQKEFAVASKIDAVYQQEVSNYALSNLMGYSEGILPTGLLIAPIQTQLKPLPYTAEMCLNIALENSPVMHVMEESVQIARYNQYRSYSMFAPQFHAYGNFDYMVSSSRYQDFHVRHNYFDGPAADYGVQANWQLFTGFSRYNYMREQQAILAGTEYQMAETYLQIVNEVLASYSLYRNSLSQAKIFADILSDAEEQRNLVVERYDAEKDSVDRVDRAQNDWVFVQTKLVTLQTDMNKAIAQLEAVLMIDLF